jgi:ADP-ribose pyrophosphatase YjhB (NUDIX family)
VPVTLEGVASACFNEKGEVLFISGGEDSFSLPRGEVKEGENALQAAIRCLEETTGILGDPDLSFAVPRIFLSQGSEGLVSYQVFVCFRWDGELKDGKEFQPAFVPLGLFQELPLEDGFRVMIISAFDLYSYCWALAAKEAGVPMPEGSEILLGFEENE